MTPEEFKKKFKVGDIITDKNYPNDFIILMLGDTRFFAREIGEGCFEASYPYELEWKKVESKKKPSEEIKAKIISLGYNASDLMDVQSLAHGFHLILEKLDDIWDKKQNIGESD